MAAEYDHQQVNLILGDYYSANPPCVDVADEALQIVNWFRNHSYALGKLAEEQKNTYKFVWALIVPVVTRWTCQFCAFQRLLKINTALHSTSIKHYDELLETIGPKVKAKKKAVEVLRRVRDDIWWSKLVMYVNTLRYKLR